eukprot:Seg2500.4 transcript_id=Seg2500.4/GoldUCD/mRNA.D3Y31 product="dCTP pyrophosphatase 1" protein_id=Seg2500.4/GoldUCD/D3Y31
MQEKMADQKRKFDMEQEKNDGCLQDDPPPKRCKFSDDLSLEEIRKMQEEFSNQRDWDQFHSPRNLLLALIGEVGELAEVFQWKGEVKEGLPDWPPKEKENVSHELSDILIYLVRLADKCDVDLSSAVREKFELNTKKYPAHIVKGSSKKYTEYKTKNETDKDTSIL